VARPAGDSVLTRRTLNRTLLARQSLLERVERSPAAMLESLVGMQAQEPPDPYVAMWSRISAFDPETLAAMLVDRTAVRIGLMRGTLHLVTARDCRALYPVMRDVLVRAFRSSPFAKQLDGVDIDELVAVGRVMLEERPHTPSELGHRLAGRWPDRDPTALAYAQRFLLPLVQVPPRGLWGRSGRATNTTAEAWLGATLDGGDAPDQAVVRYLAAFGPATASDIRTWSWLAGLRAVVERLRPILRTYRDERGRRLFDVADGVIADPGTPAPVRFLPQYDNVFLSHEDRSRINGELSWGSDLARKGVVLVDGWINGTWRVRRERGGATMTIELGRALTPPERRDLEDEAARLAGFLDPDGVRDLVLIPFG
jgi:DNA glycosylase AlkZ-like